MPSMKFAARKNLARFVRVTQASSCLLVFVFSKPTYAFRGGFCQSPWLPTPGHKRAYPKWPGRSNRQRHRPTIPSAVGKDTSAYGNTDDDDEEESEKIFVSDSAGQDWRDYRANLVLQEQKGHSSNESPNEMKGGQYAYESGQVIEKGSILLSRPKPLKFALRQQYFHKAVILVMDHDDKIGTRGIILNRPSGLIFTKDADTVEYNFRVWHGGEVDGIHSVGETQFACLHSILRSNAADVVSKLVIKDIKETSFDDAKQLVASGEAKPSDFWLFAGYCGWSPGQLQKELEQQTWIMVTVDSNTVLHELKKQSINVEPRAAGLDTWNFLMKMIKTDTSSSPTSFEDAMLKEWVGDRLLRRSAYTHENIDSLETQLLHYAPGSEGDSLVGPGQIVCASNSDRSPFLFSEQDMHKSVVLITSDNIHGTFGVFLNRPTAKTVDLPVTMKDNRSVHYPFIQRYGGSYIVYGEGEQPLFWAHCNETLRKAQVGFPLSPSGEGIWECFAEQVASALASGLAVPEDFVTVSGGFIWTKFQNGTVGGLQGEIRSSKFEVVPPNRTQDIWDLVRSQKASSGDTVDEIVAAGNFVWSVATDVGDSCSPKDAADSSRTVFQSNMTTSTLADMALKHWMTMYCFNGQEGTAS